MAYGVRGYSALPTSNSPGFNKAPEKHVAASCQLMPRRLLRLSTWGLLLVVGAILFIPSLLTVLVYKGPQYLSSDKSGVPAAPPSFLDPEIAPPILAPEAAAPEAAPSNVLDHQVDAVNTPEAEAPASNTPVPEAVPSSTPEPLAPPKIPELQSGDRRLVIVLPANNPTHDLCKVITSAVALGYPAPVILNWGKNYDDSSEWHGSSHLGKIIGTLEYLDWISRHDTHEGDKLRDDDIVLLTDSYDTWFQLPPDVLLHRYHEANRQANLRLAEQWKRPGELPMQQTIIVSTQKKCFPPPSSGSNLHCNALPESPLRSDLYGPETDQDPKCYHDVRPRYLNSGNIIGPVKDLKHYFRRVNHVMERSRSDGKYLYSDQGIFGEVFGEQEIWRQWLRDQSSVDVAGQEATLLLRENFEYHVGLDYTQQLFIPTVFEEEDGDMLTLNNETYIRERSSALGISPVRLNGVPDDLQNSTNPLKKLSSQVKSDWGEMPLYADFYTEAIPVVIHHNAHKNGLKERRTKWWDRTWYFPHLRDLLAAQLAPRERKPLARIPASGGGDVVYWAPKSYEVKRKPRMFKTSMAKKGLEEASFEKVCKSKREANGEGSHWYDQVFRDGKGAF
ncbi:hypothetical protein ACJ41O_012192 [Fusarium nematophilum]